MDYSGFARLNFTEEELEELRCYAGGRPLSPPPPPEPKPEDGWPEPVPFDERETPDFPTEALPGPLRAFVECLAEATQTPREMAGVLCLGVLAAAFQSRYDVRLTPDWEEPLCLYLAAVAPPGERKSAVLSELFKPVYQFEKCQQERQATALKWNRDERDLLERQLEAAKSAVAKGKGDAERVRELSGELAEFETMHGYRLLADDSTPERLICLMEAQGGALTICSAEGGVFDTMRGRYDRNANFDVFLKAHAGDPITVDRIGREGNRVDAPRLTMALTIQPTVLTGLMGDATFRGRGLCGRFLFAVCRSKVGRRKVEPEPIPLEVRAGYLVLVQRILPDWEAHDAQERQTIRLSPEADAVRRAFQARVEKRLGDAWSDMADWGGKLVGAVARIAALLHCVTTDKPAAEPINAETMESAVSIGEFFGKHAEAAYQMMGADGAQADARYLWRKIEGTGMKEIGKRELYRLCRGKFGTAEEMQPALDTLAEMGYIRTEEIKSGQKGRPAVKITVNPRGL